MSTEAKKSDSEPHGSEQDPAPDPEVPAITAPPASDDPNLAPTTMRGADEPIPSDNEEGHGVEQPTEDERLDAAMDGFSIGLSVRYG